MLVLGLDVSTSIIGCTILKQELSGGLLTSSLVMADALHLSKYKTVYDKSCAFKEALNKWTKDKKIDKIIIEEPLQKFARGLSSIKTIAVLIKFNGIVSYLVEDQLNITPELVSATHARKILGIKIPKGSKNKKEIILNFIMQQNEFKDFKWPTKILKSGPRKNLTIFDESCYDIADSAVMCYYNLKSNI
jgi:hypothetical protein